jgi:hypothetical protein
MCLCWHRSIIIVLAIPTKESSCDDHYYWKCKDTDKCILDSNRCNGEVDCNDGSDELNCGESVLVQ